MNIKPEELQALIAYYAKTLIGLENNYRDDLGRERFVDNKRVKETIERMSQIAKEL